MGEFNYFAIPTHAVKKRNRDIESGFNHESH